MGRGKGRLRRGGGGGRDRGGGGAGGPGRVRRVSEERVQQAAAAAAAIGDIATGLRFGCTINVGGMPPQMKFLVACTDGDVARLKEVVDSMDEDDRESLASVRMEGYGPLFEAAGSGKMDICKYLVEELGFDISAESSCASGMTPLFCTGVGRTRDCHEPNKVSADFSTPLAAVLSATPERLSESECLKCVKLLVKAGAVFNCAIPDTPLVIATRKGLTECVAYLSEVSRCANINDHDKGSDGDNRKAKLKLHGAKAVEEKDYAGAAIFYIEAIKLDPADATLYSNRSLCHLRSGRAQEASEDANACTRLRPEWTKGYYRKGSALMLLKEYKEACSAFLAGSKLDPLNDDMQNAFWEGADAMKKEYMAGTCVSQVD
ncbi:hypothetical protein E2562_001208 [Oryza meyeriana var. granulata]|uniref:Uncharacterized protein n=1 Tax=Oryza meyeriana var. granulata TaxID=110450 RepID=A0A6G1DB12_9ORYZ|nr:hypothetical protein E2562_001208 [Oryza meyeriana var. granulata]